MSLANGTRLEITDSGSAFLPSAPAPPGPVRADRAVWFPDRKRVAKPEHIKQE